MSINRKQYDDKFSRLGEQNEKKRSIAGIGFVKQSRVPRDCFTFILDSLTFQSGGKSLQLQLGEFISKLLQGTLFQLPDSLTTCPEMLTQSLERPG